MKITAISDLHGFYPKLEGGDLLIVAGDLTARDTVNQHMEFLSWLSNQNYKKKIWIAGNHDGFLENTKYVPVKETGLEYLCDSGTEFEGLKVWGSPWTPTFYDWHFMKDRGDPIKEKWDLIPDDTEILITHGPPFGIQDQVKSKEKFTGCEELRSAIDHRLKKLKLHVFGHVHEGYGQVRVDGVIHVNASIMNENYEPVNKPVNIEL